MVKESGKTVEEEAVKFVSSTVERLQERAEERRKQDELTKEELKEFQKAVNTILSSKAGKLFWKMTRKIMKIDKVDRDFTPINMAVEKAYRNYHNMVMRMASEDVRAEFYRE